jgi:putative SOS response-associated peptidase YedK
MCGRYALYDTDKLKDRFELPDEEVAEIEDDLRARYNVAPSQTMPAITEEDGHRHIEFMRWGYMPPWAKDSRSVFKYKTFNARSEDIFRKPTWKSAVRHRRCLVPSNGFYEWKATPSGKQPYFIHPTDQPLFAFAGVYGTWKDSEGVEWHDYAIITTAPNHDMENIHNRMPVILHPDEEDSWLDASLDEPETIEEFMHPYDDGRLDIYQVSRQVNSSRTEDTEALIGPLNSK